MGRIFTIFAALLALLAPAAAYADAADIDAAARGVVRVVIIGTEDGEIYPVSHGTGFAISSDKIVTNAHVVRDAMQDEGLRIGIVAAEGDEPVYGRLLRTNPRNDLALIGLDRDLRLPPLILASGPVADSGEVYSVGYPMNVDRAQGLEIGDIFQAQPPVKSRGFLSGTRPSRQFDTILHTAPIARGNSGGPLLDGCGRVLGVNSFGADSGGSDAEFFFAVSNRELVPFLRANDVEPRVNDTQCRSLADLDDDERERAMREQMQARQDIATRAETLREQRERARFEAEMGVRDERDDRMLASILLLLIAAGLIWWAVEKREIYGDEDGAAGWPQRNKIVAAVGIGMMLIALLLHLTRPGIDEIDRRVASTMAGGDGDGDTPPSGQAGTQLSGGDIGEARNFVCAIDPQRSRITNAQVEELTFEWAPSGCVNGRTQYGFDAGTWSRVLVPNDEQTVSVNSFDPERRVFRTERYLLGRTPMLQARAARRDFDAPKCETEGAAATLGEQQGAVLANLPSTPNERLVYTCEIVGE